MGIFIKEHRLLIVVQIMQVILVTGVFWLAGFKDIKLILYVIFLSLFILACYLIYYYWSRRSFYKRLETSIEQLDESLENLGTTPISESLYQLLKSQYSVYQEQTMQLIHKQEEHFIFIDRWIHQMKTPLSVIELMAKDLDEPASSSFREEADRLKTGLQMVLHMARHRSMQQDLQIKTISLIELMKEVQAENKRLFIRSNIFPKMKEKQPNLTIESDEKWLFFMVSQLIHNAVKYSQGKSNQLLITIDKQEQGTVLEIEDFGVGIPKEDMKRVFDAFYTGEKGSQYRESTGVGLYLVKEVAAYLGHRIEVESTVGEGTVFRLIF